MTSRRQTTSTESQMAGPTASSATSRYTSGLIQYTAVLVLSLAGVVSTVMYMSSPPLASPSPSPPPPPPAAAPPARTPGVAASNTEWPLFGASPVAQVPDEQKAPTGRISQAMAQYAELCGKPLSNFRSQSREDVAAFLWLMEKETSLGENSTTPTRGDLGYKWQGADSAGSAAKSVCGNDNVVVEIGAFDGMTYSNSMFFEHSLGWRSVLIEGSRSNFEAVKLNRPGANAIKIHAAICEGESISFVSQSAVGGVATEMNAHHMKVWKLNDKPIEATPCTNFKKVFADNGVTEVALFSLDVEGAETQVLAGYDWDVPVKLWIVEQPKKEIEVEGSKSFQLKETFAKHGYYPTPWDLSRFCVPGLDCTGNVAYTRWKPPQ